MPKKAGIKKVLVIGSGPNVIGQSGAFDYMAAQACRVLSEEGCKVIVVDSNPSTIITDAGFADHTYIEPLTVDSLTHIIEIEKPDSLLASLGGQTAVNLATALENAGVLAKNNVKMIGIDADVLSKCKDRTLLESVGAKTPIGKTACSMEKGIQIIREIGFPAVLRPAGAIGGAGSAVIYNMEEFGEMLAVALKASPVRKVLIERACLGNKSIEFVVLRDSSGGKVAVGIENIEPTGIHSGDSTSVYPIQSLGENQIKELKELSKKIADAIGVIGSITVSFAIESDGRVTVLNADPAITNTCALASKMAGIPIGAISAKLAIGFDLDSEYKLPTDHVAVKMSRFDFDKFPGADTTLNTSMKSVGEVIGFGKSFKEAMQKAVHSLEVEYCKTECPSIDEMADALIKPNPKRLCDIKCAVAAGLSDYEICDITKTDPFFVKQIREMIGFEQNFEGKSLVGVSSEVLLEAKKLGYSDAQLADLFETDEEQVRTRRDVLDIQSGFECTGEGFFSTYDTKSASEPLADQKKVIIIGGGPNRIGQGTELDYCCVHASAALMSQGYKTVIINCNPEAVSTDPNLSDKLYFEPVTVENVLGIIEREKPMGVILAFGGNAALKLSAALIKAGVNILGTPPESIERASNRKLFAETMVKLGLKDSHSQIISSGKDALKSAESIGYPVLVRCGYTTQVAYDDDDLAAFVEKVEVSADRPVALDKFIEGATKVDVVAVSDSETSLICAVMEHIEQAGVHSGDSACAIPPFSLPAKTIDEVKRQTKLVAKELGIKGLINAHFAVKDNLIHILGVNPQATRLIPFVCKATGVDWIGSAARVAAGSLIEELGLSEIKPGIVSVKEAVFPFTRFPGVDVVLGPQMKSTGEVMGINESFGAAYIKAEIAAGQLLPDKGTVFVSIADSDKAEAIDIAQKLNELGFDIVATRGTARALKSAGLSVKTLYKIGEGRPDATDLIKNEEIDLIINTPSGKKPRQHEITIRSAIVARGIPIITTIAGAKATVLGMETVRKHKSAVHSLQDY